jgi:hypothetical protein
MTAAMSGCFPGGCCNANPDPCCSAPKSQQCAEWQGCEDSGTNDVEACYLRLDLSLPDLKPPADLVSVHDVGSDHD